MNKKHGAYFILEIAFFLIFVACISLAAFSFHYGDTMDTGKVNIVKSETSAIGSAVSQYKFEVGEYPSSLNDLLTQKDGRGPWYVGKGSSAPFDDPWHNRYQYKSDDNGFTVYSTMNNKHDVNKFPVTTNGSDTNHTIPAGSYGFSGM